MILYVQRASGILSEGRAIAGSSERKVLFERAILNLRFGQARCLPYLVRCCRALFS